ncbi:MAG: sulfite exporter TauE/SafE family protein [Anaerolineae bacterium]|nr:sulfite exporter TauE/SafE family protein [Anaerolineae bacterium]MCA9890160.1 sulfite exporter TauE/SafE family protein [Anaerolineae bacterium]MCA9893318.1 sulfite exporter TauE/SafE family protein [Anaerolineae bacterium]
MEFLGYPPIFWVTAVLAVVLVGIAKSGFGGGAGVIATPLMSLTIPVADAAAILLPLLLIIDVFSLWHYHKDWDRPTIRATLPGAIVGIVIGGLFFSVMADHEQLLKVAIGVIAIAFVIWQLGKNVVFKLPTESIPTWTGWPLGILAGFGSTLAHVGGPPFVIYLLPQNLPQRIFVGTSVVFFFVVNLTKLIPYALLGLLTVGNLSIVVVLIPVAYLGVVLGIWLNKRFSPIWFNRLVYILLILTAFQLLIGDSFLRMALQG